MQLISVFLGSAAVTEYYCLAKVGMSGRYWH